MSTDWLLNSNCLKLFVRGREKIFLILGSKKNLKQLNLIISQSCEFLVLSSEFRKAAATEVRRPSLNILFTVESLKN